MNTHFKIIITAIIIAFTTASCGGNKGSSVDAALSQIEKAMEKVEKNKTSMTQADWDALNEELEGPAKILNEALESDQVGTMKKLQISTVMLRYAAVIGTAAMHTVTEQIGETHLVDSLSVVGEKLQEALGSDEMQEAMQEMQKAMEGLQKLGQ